MREFISIFGIVSAFAWCFVAARVEDTPAVRACLAVLFVASLCIGYFA